MTIEELSKKLNISISNIRTNFPRVYKKFTIKGKSYFVHRIVLETFSPIKDSENYTVDHIKWEKK